MVVLYHYTNGEGKQGIQRSGLIKCARRHTHHGAGVYFTSLPSDTDTYSRQQIARNNYRIGANKNMDRTEWVVEVDLPNAEVERCPDPHRNLWKYPNRNLPLSQYQHRIYRFGHSR